jgi:SPP1 gp7 family putative phage head morphogenesis protein
VLHHTSPAERFKRSVQISKQFLPRHARRVRLPRKQWPKAVSRAYLQQIQVYLQAAHALVEREIVPMLPALAAAGRQDAADAARLDAGQSDFNKKMDELSKQFFDRLPTADIERLAEDFARRTSSFEKSESMKEIRAAFGVDVMANEPNLSGKVDNFVAENVALIKSIPSQFFDDVEKQVMRAVSQAQTADQLAKVIADRYGVAQDRAALVARDQIGKFYGKVTQARQESIGVTHYIWRTSNDERVREEHAAREGQTFAWDDPPEDGAPGEAINCRCFAEPDLTPLLSGDEPLDQSEPEPEAEPADVPDQPPQPSPEDLARQQAEEADRARAAAEADAQRAREAHNEEVSKRLAEQEIARENMRLLRESMAKQEADAERQAAELAAAHARAEAEAQARLAAEAEAARLRAEQEAASRAYAEAQARRQAEQEAAAAEAEAKRQAEQARNPLKEAHLAAAQTPREVSLAVARERHFEAARDLKVDPEGFAANLRDVEAGGSKTAAAQAMIREDLNAICAKQGARIAQADLQHADGRAFEVERSMKDALAMHYWDGKIAVGDPAILVHSADFMSNVSRNPNHYRDESERIRTEREALTERQIQHNAEKKVLDARRFELRFKKRPSKADKAELAEVEAKQEALQPHADLLAAHDQNLRDAEKKMQNEIRSTAVLVHEAMHGHSPMAPSAYELGTVGVPVEEISTELAARETLAQQFGISNKPLDAHWKSTYSWFIDPAIQHVTLAADAAGVTKVFTPAEEADARQRAYEALTRASLALKADHTTIAATPENHLRRLADKLADDYKLEGKVREDFLDRVKRGFDTDIRNRKG